MYDDCPQTETPVGSTCIYCDELIAMGEDGVILADGTSVLHRECNLRMVAGSLAHQQRRCTCYGGTGSDEEEGMTRRQGAQAVLEYLEGQR
jgi:hypothetical protein